MEGKEDTKEGNEKSKQRLSLVADVHEKNSLIFAELVNLGMEIELEKLEVGDYVIKDIIIERKTVRDFLSSMLSKRLQKQLISLSNVEKKLLILENFGEQYDVKINTNAIRGFIMSILLDFKIPIIFTEDYQDTAYYLYLLAKKQQLKHVSIRAKRKAFNKKEQVQYLLEGFPGVGPATAKKLIEKFKTIKNVINASSDDLKEVLGKKAELFIELVEKEF